MSIEIYGALENFRVLLTESEIQTRIRAMALEINQAYPEKEPLVALVVLHGALFFAADLVRHLSMPTEIESVRIKSYIGTQSQDSIELLSALSPSLAHKNVLIIEDIVDTGRSIQFLKKQLNALNVKSARVCTLLNKPNEHLVSVQTDYVGFNIGKNFVVGYGLDFDGKYRNLPYIVEVVG